MRIKLLPLLLVFILCYNPIYSQNILTPKELAKAKEYRNWKDAIDKPLKVHKLNLKRSKLSELPREIGKFKNLQILELGSNKFKVLPRELGRLKKLQYLGLSYSRNLNINKAMPVIVKLKLLENIDLSDNQLKQLPRDIARLKNLKQINLSYNKNI
ncbi:MAG: leucine-rich repeat domain-containing protein, partial [Bacteroidetes bacterium]|nr:leucine-rich repeat domain-containing protein [Bacteroidota bacterium]